MNDYMKDSIKSFIAHQLDDYEANFDYAVEAMGYDDKSVLIDRIKDQSRGDDAPDVLYKMMTDYYELFHNDMCDGSGEDLMFEGYSIDNLWGREPDCYYNFISVYSNLDNDDLIYDEMSDYLDKMNNYLDGYVGPEDIYDFADSYTAMNGENNFDSWNDLKYIYVEAIKEYLKENYNAVLLRTDDFVREIVNWIIDDTDFHEVSKDEFSKDDWGF